MSGLNYIGNGAALIGVPARDLTEADLKNLPEDVTAEWLVASGLYKNAEKLDAPIKRDNKKERE